MMKNKRTLYDNLLNGSVIATKDDYTFQISKLFSYWGEQWLYKIQKVTLFKKCKYCGHKFLLVSLHRTSYKTIRRVRICLNTTCNYIESRNMDMIWRHEQQPDDLLKVQIAKIKKKGYKEHS